MPGSRIYSTGSPGQEIKGSIETVLIRVPPIWFELAWDAVIITMSM